MTADGLKRRQFTLWALGATGAAMLPGAPAAAAARSTARLVPDLALINGTVLTMTESMQESRAGVVKQAEAVAVKDGLIVAVGSTAEIRRLCGTETEVIDLKEATLIPGFIDAHSHFPGSGINALYQANLSGPPVGPIESVDGLVETLTAWANHAPDEPWIRGTGYDQTLLRELRHPTRWDLDKVSTSRPIWIGHTNGHMGVANSTALEIAGVTKDTQDPPGGFIARDPQTGEPTGLLQEPAAMSLVRQHMPPFSDEQITEAVKASIRLYAAAGVTTSIIAHGDRKSLMDLQAWREQNLLPLRFVMMQWANPTPTEAGGVFEGFGDDFLAVGPYGEAVHDGSIQGYTGFLTDPYHRLLSDAPYPADWRGFPNESREELTDRVTTLLELGLRSALHGNGDAAIDNLVHAFRAALEKTPSTDVRWRVEHAQMARPDQLDAFAELGVTPSFFVSHVYYWGDQHRDIFLGPERAARISPLRSALDRGLRFSIHLDSPVVPMEPLHAMWCAVNRLTRSGQVLGRDERITPIEALRALTIDAAWQNFLEDNRGSIEPGKLADFVVLAQDPLGVSPRTIKDIDVLRVMVGGKTVFDAAR